MDGRDYKESKKKKNKKKKTKINWQIKQKAEVDSSGHITDDRDERRGTLDNIRQL